jgi:hypothetical protein
MFIVGPIVERLDRLEVALECYSWIADRAHCTSSANWVVINNKYHHICRRAAPGCMVSGTFLSLTGSLVHKLQPMIDASHPGGTSDATWQGTRP